jgi:hypothetical protein
MAPPRERTLAKAWPKAVPITRRSRSGWSVSTRLMDNLPEAKRHTDALAEVCRPRSVDALRPLSCESFPPLNRKHLA